MYTAALLFSSMAAASALSSNPTTKRTTESTFIERRDYGGENCDTSWTNAEENGAICWELGWLSNEYNIIGYPDVSTGLPTQCREECERNPDCKSMAFIPWMDPEFQCRLYAADLPSMGFFKLSDPNSAGYFGGRECWKLSGMCEMHSGGFEIFSGAPLSNGMVHPWSTKLETVGLDYGTNFTVVNSGTSQAWPVPRTPYGSSFAKAIVNDYIGVAALSQFIFPIPTTNYTLSYAYNFASFQLGKGRKKPKSYLIKTFYCNSVIDVFELPVTKAHKKWKNHSKQVSLMPCEDASTLDIQIMPAEHDSTDVGLFEAIFGIDNIKLESIE